jgi:hypothetical protein
LHASFLLGYAWHLDGCFGIAAVSGQVKRK